MVDKDFQMPDNTWKCSNCGYALKARKPPDRCPSCGHECEFLNITCYTPDCEFSGTDDRLK